LKKPKDHGLHEEHKEEGLEVVAQALKAVYRTDERVNEDELYRLQGKLLQRQGVEPAKIETLLKQELDPTGKSFFLREFDITTIVD